MKKFILAMLLVLSLSSFAHAIPALQLDISGGTYDGAKDVETIVSNGPVFDLYALAWTSKFDKRDNRYFISMAVIPSLTQTTPGPDLGSFTVNGSVINVTKDMVYGIPPIELNGTAAFDAGDLPAHGIFQTYFYEYAFSFDKNRQIAAYDTMERAEDGSAIPATGSGLYYHLLKIDTSRLMAGYQIHFDLYHEKFKSGDTDVDLFAPFSHDAQSGGVPVPEPSTLLLLGAGLAGLGLYGRRKARK